MLDAARIQWECSVMEVLPDALTVAWVLAVVAGVALLLSMRTPRLGSRLGWVYPVVMAVASVAVLVVDAAWWLTRSDPRAAAVAGVAGLWLWVAVRERIRVLERRREEFVAVGRRRVPTRGSAVEPAGTGDLWAKMCGIGRRTRRLAPTRLRTPAQAPCWFIPEVAVLGGRGSDDG
jgi:hypothetical protein